MAGRSADANPERACERRLDHPGVRDSDAVPRRGATPRPHPSGIPDGGRHDHQRRGEPGRYEVGEVVQSRVRPNQIGHTSVTGTDHRVERVDRRVDQRSRGPADHRPQQRGNLCVRCVLGQRLQCRAGQPVGVERGGIAAAQRRQQPPGRTDVARRQRVRHRRDRSQQRRAAQRRPRRGGDADPASNTLDRHAQKPNSAEAARRRERRRPTASRGTSSAPTAPATAPNSATGWPRRGSANATSANQPSSRATSGFSAQTRRQRLTS